MVRAMEKLDDDPSSRLLFGPHKKQRLLCCAACFIHIDSSQLRHHKFYKKNARSPAPGGQDAAIRYATFL